MMKKQYNKNKKHTMTGKLWNSKEKSILIIIGVSLLLLALGLYIPSAKEDIKKRNAYKAFIDKEIPDSMVCMVSGEIKHKAIDPVEVNGKTYWGCCNTCIIKLTYNTSNAQFAKDPISGSLVSKADAIIRLNPNNNRQAMFFESDETYREYMNGIKENNQTQ